MKTKTILLVIALVSAFTPTVKAVGEIDSSKIYYQSAFAELKNMMDGKLQPVFERAVFVSENPYHENKYSYSAFQKSIDFHLFFIQCLADANNRSDTMNYVPKVNKYGRFNVDEILISPERKKELYNNAVNNWAIFTYIEDTTGVYPFCHTPFKYATSDPFGMKDWSSSQVMNLFISKKQQGNCFALTGFFKIMADRMKTGAYICTAPQHIYIQHQDNKGDYYNVELATAGHPGDGILQTLTYTTSTAIDNGIALRSYDERQNIGLCIVNLAKSYEHKFNTKDDDFLLQCAETVLKNDSLNLNALLLKHQVLNERMLKHISQNKTTAIGKLIEDKTVSKTFYELEKHLARLNTLGYLQMPMDVQEIVLNGFQAKEGVPFIDRNPKPFDPLTGVPEDENHFSTLTGGLFQEVFEPRKFEEYGQFTFDTETKAIVAIDTTKKNTFLIDPVAFAYDFGARMYDPRTGLWSSIDPQASKYPYYSPYSAFGNSPIRIVDPGGETLKVITNDPNRIEQYKTLISTAFSNKISADVVDGVVTFHNVPGAPDLDQFETAALAHLNTVVNSDLTVYQILYNHEDAISEYIDGGSYYESSIDMDDMAVYGNDNTRMTTKGKLVHEAIEQLGKMERIAKGESVAFEDGDEKSGYNQLHFGVALQAENETSMYKRSGLEFEGQGEMGSIKEGENTRYFMAKDTKDGNGNITGVKYEENK